MASTFSSCFSASNCSFDTFCFGGAVLNELSFLLDLAILLKQKIILESSYIYILLGISWSRIFSSFFVDHFVVNWSTEVSALVYSLTLFSHFTGDQTKKTDQGLLLGKNYVNNTINEEIFIHFELK